MPNVFTRSAFSDSAYKGVPNPTEPSVGTSVAYLFDLTPGIVPWQAISSRRLNGSVSTATNWHWGVKTASGGTEYRPKFNEDAELDTAFFASQGFNTGTRPVRFVREQAKGSIWSGTGDNNTPLYKIVPHSDNISGKVKPTLMFDGSGRALQSLSLAWPAGPYTLFCVFRCASAAPSGAVPVFAANNTGATSGVLFRLNTFDTPNQIQFFGNGTNAGRAPQIKGSLVNGNTIVDGKFHTAVVHINTEGGFVRLDGIPLSINVLVSGNVPGNTGNSGIGSLNGGSTNVLDGFISELIIYTGTTLTNAQVSAVESNIRQYWGTP